MCDFWTKDLGYANIYNNVQRIRMCSEKKKNYPDDQLVLFRNRKLVNWKQSTGLGNLLLGDRKEGPNCVWFTKFLLQGVSTFHYTTSGAIPLVLWDSSRTQKRTIWPNEINSSSFWGEFPKLNNSPLCSTSRTDRKGSGCLWGMIASDSIKREWDGLKFIEMSGNGPRPVFVK